jgi:hypothetical protein
VPLLLRRHVDGREAYLTVRVPRHSEMGARQLPPQVAEGVAPATHWSRMRVLGVLDCVCPRAARDGGAATSCRHAPHCDAQPRRHLCLLRHPHVRSQQPGRARRHVQRIEARAPAPSARPGSRPCTPCAQSSSTVSSTRQPRSDRSERLTRRTHLPPSPPPTRSLCQPTPSSHALTHDAHPTPSPHPLAPSPLVSALNAASCAPSSPLCVRAVDSRPQVETAAAASNMRVDWRRGGPVCGGRYGVTSYTLLHTVGASTARGSVRRASASRTPPSHAPRMPSGRAPSSPSSIAYTHTHHGV